MTLKLTNNAKTTLAAAVGVSDTTLTVSTGQGALFPVLDTGDWHPLTLIRADAQYEIVRVTSRTGDVLTVERAREGTTALTFNPGDPVELRLTEEAVGEFALSGQQDFTVLRGINYAVATGTVGSNVYNANVTNVAAYTNNLRLSILPHSFNTTAASAPLVNVNGLGTVEVVLPDGSNPHVGAIAQFRVMEIHYRDAIGKFILDNAVAESAAPATTTTAGVVIRGTEEDFDINGDNEKYTTQRNVSRMIEDSLPETANYNPIWTFQGNGAGGNQNILSGNTLNITGAQENQYGSVTINPGATLMCQSGAVNVLRCTGAFDCQDALVMPRSRNQTNSYPHHEHVGPNGGLVGAGALSVFRSHGIWGDQGDGSLTGASPTVRDYAFHILGGTPQYAFHGGHGEAANTQKQPSIAGGCFIIIAPSITFGPGADVSNMFAGAYDQATGFQGASGGGVLILVTETLDINATCDFEAGRAGNFRTAADWASGSFDNEERADALPGDSDFYAGNGQCLHFNPVAGTFTLIF